jgi:small GTP-binding protein
MPGADAELVRRQPVQPVARDVHNAKVVVVGDIGTGKTALVQAFLSERLGQRALAGGSRPTVGADFEVRSMKHRGKDLRVNLWDCSGDQRFTEVRNEFYKEAHGVLLVYDVTSRSTFQNLQQWLSEATRHSSGDAQFAVVAAKVESGPRAVPEQTGRDWAAHKGVPYFEVSAAHRTNLEAPFLGVVEKALL